MWRQSKPLLRIHKWSVLNNINFEMDNIRLFNYRRLISY